MHLVLRLIQSHLVTAGYFETRHQPPLFVLDPRGELDASTLEVIHRLVEIVAEERDVVELPV
ncbi:MAG: hypothetical protein Q8R78_07660 [Candidatus Omnitrophota bacterium]|nr:hypothetical protein [Candidatus Omnitrophota bacterium]